MFTLERLAIPTDTILAEAPIMVKLPPKQAPRESAHHKTLWGMAVASNNGCDHGK